MRRGRSTPLEPFRGELKATIKNAGTAAANSSRLRTSLVLSTYCFNPALALYLTENVLEATSPRCTSTRLDAIFEVTVLDPNTRTPIGMAAGHSSPVSYEHGRRDWRVECGAAGGGAQQMGTHTSYID